MEYFAALLDEQELCNKIMEKITFFQDYTLKSGKALNWQKNKDYYEQKFYTTYEGLDILDAGEQGELLAMAVNHFRNVIRHTINPIVSAVPTFTVTAANSSTQSRRSADMGKQIVMYYDKVKRYDKISKRVAEYAVCYGDGYQVNEWNPLLGQKVIDKNAGVYKPQGDFDVEAVSVWDMFFDFTLKGTQDWYCFRRRKNKFDIAASFSNDPEKQEKIINLSPFYQTDRYFTEYKNYYGNENTDEVFVYSFYHRDRPSVPGGRYALFCGDSENTIPLFIDENIYGDELPVFPMQPALYLETPFGFTEANTFRGVQEFMNDLVSKMLTNAQSALKDIWFPKGEEVSIETLSSGRSIIQTTIKPEVVDLYAGDNGLIELFSFAKSQMELLSAQNAVVRGDVASAPNLKSGIAIQTVVNMGQQYAQSLLASYKELFEDVNTFMIKTLKKFATTERLIDIVGKEQTTSVMAYTNTDINDVSRVIVEEVNPLLHSPAGRYEVASDMLKNGLIDKNEYFDVLNNGNIDSGTFSKKAMLFYVSKVKDMLLDGQQVQPISGVDHKYVLTEVHALLCDPEFTMNPQNQPIVQNIMQFEQASMNILRNGDELSGLIYAGLPPTPALQPGMPIPPQGQQGQPPVPGHPQPPPQQGAPKPQLGVIQGGNPNAR